MAGPLGRTALGGRNWEGFTVDPYLSGVLTAETIKGMQDAGVIANLKVSSQKAPPLKGYSPIVKMARYPVKLTWK